MLLLAYWRGMVMGHGSSRGAEIMAWTRVTRVVRVFVLWGLAVGCLVYFEHSKFVPASWWALSQISSIFFVRCLLLLATLVRFNWFLVRTLRPYLKWLVFKLLVSYQRRLTSDFVVFLTFDHLLRRGHAGVVVLERRADRWGEVEYFRLLVREPRSPRFTTVYN
jgi:hypothetical protein